MSEADLTTEIVPGRDGDEDDRRLRTGQLMIAVAVVGVVVAVAGTVVGWRLVGDVRAATGDSVVVTLETLDSVEDTIDLSEQVLTSIRSTVATTESTLTAVDDSFTVGGDVIAEVAELTEEVGPSLADAARILRQLEGVGSTIDSVLGGLSRVPLGPDYDPDQALGDTVGQLADTIGRLPERFESTAADLNDFDRSVLDISAQIVELTATVSDVRRSLDEATQLVSDYRANVRDARAVALDARTNLDTDVGLMRVLIVIGGITFAFGQIVPFWLGRQLVSRSRTAATRVTLG